MPINTNPMRTGAPLDPDLYPDIARAFPRDIDIDEELKRARVELMHAIARHRKAWAKMRAIRDELEARAKESGIEAYPDNNTLYKIAVADVRWWREEMTAQATAVTALTGMMPKPTVQVQAGGHVPNPPVDTLFGWPINSNRTPTKNQYAYTKAWLADRDPNQLYPSRMLAAADALIEAYELANPEARPLRQPEEE